MLAVSFANLVWVANAQWIFVMYSCSPPGRCIDESLVKLWESTLIDIGRCLRINAGVKHVWVTQVSLYYFVGALRIYWLFWRQQRTLNSYWENKFILYFNLNFTVACEFDSKLSFLDLPPYWQLDNKNPKYPAPKPYLGISTQASPVLLQANVVLWQYYFINSLAPVVSSFYWDKQSGWRMHWWIMVTQQCLLGSVALL